MLSVPARYRPETEGPSPVLRLGCSPRLRIVARGHHEVGPVGAALRTAKPQFSQRHIADLSAPPPIPRRATGEEVPVDEKAAPFFKAGRSGASDSIAGAGDRRSLVGACGSAARAARCGVVGEGRLHRLPRIALPARLTSTDWHTAT